MSEFHLLPIHITQTLFNLLYFNFLFISLAFHMIYSNFIYYKKEKSIYQLIISVFPSMVSEFHPLLFVIWYTLHATIFKGFLHPQHKLYSSATYISSVYVTKLIMQVVYQAFRLLCPFVKSAKPEPTIFCTKM